MTLRELVNQKPNIKVTAAGRLSNTKFAVRDPDPDALTIHVPGEFLDVMGAARGDEIERVLDTLTVIEWQSWERLPVKTKIGEELKQELDDGCWHAWPGENPLEHVLPVGYDSEIVDDLHNVMRLLRGEPALYCDKIAVRLGLDRKYVHLILEVLADRDYTEYGTSPRGSWLTKKGEELLNLADEWRD